MEGCPHRNGSFQSKWYARNRGKKVMHKYGEKANKKFDMEGW